MFGLFDYMGSLGHYMFKMEIPKTRGKGHFKKAHRNNYKQKIKNKRNKK